MKSLTLGLCVAAAMLAFTDTVVARPYRGAFYSGNGSYYGRSSVTYRGRSYSGRNAYYGRNYYSNRVYPTYYAPRAYPSYSYRY